VNRKPLPALVTNGIMGLRTVSMLSAKSICRRVGCSNLVDRPGYCHLHEADGASRFDLHRAPGSREFYCNHKWTQTALTYRKGQPLCEQCKRTGQIVKGNLVDHKIERPELEAKGLNPYDFVYLQTLCTSCHNKKLRARSSAQIHSAILRSTHE
jgi:5-methylcytosine-specific restriction endonuclease McrA